MNRLATASSAAGGGVAGAVGVPSPHPSTLKPAARDR